MKVTASNYEAWITSAYQAASLQEDEKEQETKAQIQEAEEEQEQGNYDSMETSVTGLSINSTKNSDKTSGSSNDMKMKSSTPEEKVGELASMLARARTKFDVLQVQGKAMRALTNLQMSVATVDSKDRTKVLQQIKRMKKLVKNINKKMKNLNKEEQMERQQEKAIKRQEEEKARQIEEELRAKRNKRRKEEQNYAQKECAKDHMGGSEGSPANGWMPEVGTIPSVTGTPTMTGTGYDASGSLDAAVSMSEGVSLDISV